MLGERLRQARLAAGLSLEGLAERLDRPVTKQALSKYERGLSQPPPSRLADIAAALNVRASSLFAESDVQIEWVGANTHHGDAATGPHDRGAHGYAAGYSGTFEDVLWRR